jgi:phosphatidylserine/phosphatidylglycerophosphate/cardiolipin synthase-like enzyme
MPRVKVGPALPDGSTLDVASLLARLHNVLRRGPSPHLPRHLLFRILAYRLQADRLGDLDVESRRLLDGVGPPEDAGKRAVDRNRPTAELRPGTTLAREWNGRMHRVAVLADGFAWNGKTYPSLSKIALAITGTRWNGPRFFGLRHKASKEVRS